MTVLEFEDETGEGKYGFGPILTREITSGPWAGYTEDYQEIYNNGEIVKAGDTVFVKDGYHDEWLEAEFVDWRDEGLAKLVG
ncbi:MAG: hypothetical protein IJH34_03500, partial [Romboutsia sp.]|nr:hypothetical protein [Romboutsia sp.]